MMDSEIKNGGVAGRSTSSYRNDFLQLVAEGYYELETHKLPSVINLIEVDTWTRNNALHTCAQNNFLTTFRKILFANHPAVSLILSQINSGGCSPLGLLILKNFDSTAFATNALIKDVLVKMQSMLTVDKIHEILHPIIKHEILSKNEQLMGVINPFYQNNLAKFPKDAESGIQEQPRATLYSPMYQHISSAVSVPPQPSSGSRQPANMLNSATPTKIPTSKFDYYY